MCSVNDKIREKIRSRIDGYNTTKSGLEEVKKKVEAALLDNHEALNYAKCVTTNLDGINLGGNQTIDSVSECKSSIDARIEFFNGQLKNINDAIKKLEEAIKNAENEYNNVPIDCGVCSECCPPKPTKVV